MRNPQLTNISSTIFKRLSGAIIPVLFDLVAEYRTIKYLVRCMTYVCVPIAGYFINTLWKENVYRGHGDRRWIMLSIQTLQNLYFLGYSGHNSIQQVARWMRNDTRTAKEATAAARWFTRSVDGVTEARAGKQLVIKDGTPCKDVSVPLDRPVGGEGWSFGKRNSLRRRAVVSVRENDVSVTVDCGAVAADAVQLGHVENRRFFMPAPTIHQFPKTRHYHHPLHTLHRHSVNSSCP